MGLSGANAVAAQPSSYHSATLQLTTMSSDAPLEAVPQATQPGFMPAVFAAPGGGMPVPLPVSEVQNFMFPVGWPGFNPPPMPMPMWSPEMFCQPCAEPAGSTAPAPMAAYGEGYAPDQAAVTEFGAAFHGPDYYQEQGRYEDQGSYEDQGRYEAQDGYEDQGRYEAQDGYEARDGYAAEEQYEANEEYTGYDEQGTAQAPARGPASKKRGSKRRSGRGRNRGSETWDAAAGWHGYGHRSAGTAEQGRGPALPGLVVPSSSGSAASSQAGRTPPRSSSDAELLRDLPDLSELFESKDVSNIVVKRLSAAKTPEEKKALVEWLLPETLNLALAPAGCYVIQAAIEVAEGGEGMSREQLVKKLQHHVVELYESPHGNHVLCKLIEIVPGASLKEVVKELESKDPLEIAQHRFGCRVLERLIEHCHEKYVGGMLKKITDHAPQLAKHKFGNFVIQHLIEHSHDQADRRNCIVQKLLPDIPQLAMHRSASHVVQMALKYGSEDEQVQVIQALLNSSTTDIVDVACNRYGSFVIEQLATDSPWGSQCPVTPRLYQGLERLVANEFGTRVAAKFKFVEVPEPPAPAASA